MGCGFVTGKQMNSRLNNRFFVCVYTGFCYKLSVSVAKNDAADL
jgi:hypothetical protein